MSYPWDDIKIVIEKMENERVLNELSSLEQEDGFVKKWHPLTERTGYYLNFLGILSVGLSIGIISLIFNFILFVLLLHLEF